MNNSLDIKICIKTALFKNINDHLKSTLSDIFEAHNKMTGSSHNKFMYDGEVYYRNHTVAPFNETLLELSLHNKMDQYLELLAKYKKDEKLILNYIGIIISISNTVKDTFTKLPNALTVFCNRHINPPLDTNYIQFKDFKKYDAEMDKLITYYLNYHLLL